MSGGLFQGDHTSLPHGGGGGHQGGGGAHQGGGGAHQGGGGGHQGGVMDGVENEMNQAMEQGVNPLLCFLCHQVSQPPPTPS